MGAASGAVTSTDSLATIAGTEAGTAATGDGDRSSGVSSRGSDASRPSARVVPTVAGCPVPASAVGTASPTTGRFTGGTQDTPSNDNANATR